MSIQEMAQEVLNKIEKLPYDENEIRDALKEALDDMGLQVKFLESLGSIKSLRARFRRADGIFYEGNISSLNPLVVSFAVFSEAEEWISISDVPGWMSCVFGEIQVSTEDWNSIIMRFLCFLLDTKEKETYQTRAYGTIGDVPDLYKNLSFIA